MKIQGKTAAQIVDCVRALVQSQQLLPGQALPPVRELAAELDINRNTVAAAYKRLAAAGIALTQGRLGTVIRDPYGAGEQEGALPDTPLTDLASGNPRREWLPDMARAFAARPYRPRLYGEPTVNPGLETYGRGWLAPDCPGLFDINVTHGAVDAIERLLVSHLVPGDKVAVENPASQQHQYAALGRDGGDRRGDGRRGHVAPGAGSRAGKGREGGADHAARAQPHGMQPERERARALARVLARHPQVLAIVDDHFALLSNAAYHSALPTGAPRWALVRSLTKALGPDIRVALVASDAATSRQLRLRLASGTSWVSHVLQDMVEAALGQTEVAQ